MSSFLCFSFKAKLITKIENGRSRQCRDLRKKRFKNKHGILLTPSSAVTSSTRTTCNIPVGRTKWRFISRSDNDIKIASNACVFSEFFFNNFNSPSVQTFCYVIVKLLMRQESSLSIQHNSKTRVRVHVNVASSTKKCLYGFMSTRQHRLGNRFFDLENQ